MQFAAYDRIAGEYYDDFHQTCRNFDETTRHALDLVRKRVPHAGLILDVGCGRGRCGEFLGVESNRIVQLDNSRVMLALSPREECMLQVCHDAEKLPFVNSTFACVAAFLCDPFLGLEFLAESYRVLTNNGVFVATTPAYEWGTALRRTLPIDISETRFATKAGGEVIVPSVLVPTDQLADMLEKAGFSEEKITIQKRSLPLGAQPISKDVSAAAERLKCDAHELDLLYLVTANK